MDYLLRSGKDEAASPYSNIGDQYYSPSTSDVLSAFTEEAFKGIGTGYADIQALKVTQQQRQGDPMTEEAYKASPYYRPGVSYSRDMTSESAKTLAEYNDEREKNAFIINHASTAQKAAGYTTSFGAGIFEPKNIATGVAASAVLSPIIGGLAPEASSLRRILQLKKALGRYGDKALIGGVEGMVAAAAAEPSNQYSAGILKQDYTMTDSLWNVGLSAAFGAGFNSVPSFIKDKWQAHGGETPSIIAHELDTATNQLAVGQKIDVSHVERVALGEVAKKPIAEQARVVEEYLGLNKDLPTLDETITAIKQQGVDIFASEGKSAINVSKIAVPKDMREQGIGTAAMKSIIDYADATGKTITLSPSADFGGSKPRLIKFYKGLGFVENKGKNKDFAISDSMYRTAPESKLSSYEINTAARRIDTENSQAINKSIIDSVDPKNDTAIDLGAAKELDAFDENLKADDAAVKASYDNYLKEISFMKKEGLMTDAEIELFTDAINSVSEKDIQSGYDALLTCLTRG
jgi:GNAT superfamily N-acetyltransferase